MAKQMSAADAVPNAQKRFCSVASAAQVFDVSEMTLYRAIRNGQFPAVRIMGRLVVPLKAIEAIEDAASERHTLVDAADWVDRYPVEQAGRPRPGADQFAVGSFSPQHVARYGEEDATPALPRPSRGGVA
jgi:excisionase family DNA binding protein